MTKLLRFTSVAATVAALSLTSAPAFAAASTATANPQAKATVNILKPLSLVAEEDLDLGTVALGTTPFSTTVGYVNGTFVCDNTMVTCSGTPQKARYNVSGTKDKVVNITVDDVELENAAGDKLTLKVEAVDDVTLPDSGSQDFDVAGNVALTQATPDGEYEGELNVTADYE